MTTAKSATTMLQQVLGAAAFAALHPAVQRFHALAGKHRLQGLVTAAAPAGAAARWMARCLGAPHDAVDGPLQFDLLAAPNAELWTRHFPASPGSPGPTMHSRLHQEGDCVVETLGPARVRFAYAVAHGGLSMRLVGLHFCGVPCPRWLAPRITATERGEGDRLHFDVRAVVPLIGQVAHYRGHLQMPAEGGA